MMWGCFIGGIQGSLIPIYGDSEAARGGLLQSHILRS